MLHMLHVVVHLRRSCARRATRALVGPDENSRQEHLEQHTASVVRVLYIGMDVENQLESILARLPVARRASPASRAA